MCGSNELDLDGVANRCTYVRRVVDLPRKKKKKKIWVLACNQSSVLGMEPDSHLIK